ILQRSLFARAMPPGLLPTAFLDRLGECVPTYRLGLEGPAADQTPRCGNSRPTNAESASLSRLKPKYRCGLASALVQARLDHGATCPRCACVLSRRPPWR